MLKIIKFEYVFIVWASYYKSSIIIKKSTKYMEDFNINIKKALYSIKKSAII